MIGLFKKKVTMILPGKKQNSKAMGGNFALFSVLVSVAALFSSLSSKTSASEVPKDDSVFPTGGDLEGNYQQIVYTDFEYESDGETLVVQTPDGEIVLHEGEYVFYDGKIYVLNSTLINLTEGLAATEALPPSSASNAYSLPTLSETTTEAGTLAGVVGASSLNLSGGDSEGQVAELSSSLPSEPNNPVGSFPTLDLNGGSDGIVADLSSPLATDPSNPVGEFPSDIFNDSNTPIAGVPVAELPNGSVEDVTNSDNLNNGSGNGFDGVVSDDILDEDEEIVDPAPESEVNPLPELPGMGSDPEAAADELTVEFNKDLFTIDNDLLIDASDADEVLLTVQGQGVVDWVLVGPDAEHFQIDDAGNVRFLPSTVEGITAGGALDESEDGMFDFTIVAVNTDGELITDEFGVYVYPVPPADLLAPPEPPAPPPIPEDFFVPEAPDIPTFDDIYGDGDSDDDDMVADDSYDDFYDESEMSGDIYDDEAPADEIYDNEGVAASDIYGAEDDGIAEDITDDSAGVFDEGTPEEAVVEESGPEDDSYGDYVLDDVLADDIFDFVIGEEPETPDGVQEFDNEGAYDEGLISGSASPAVDDAEYDYSGMDDFINSEFSMEDLMATAVDNTQADYLMG